MRLTTVARNLRGWSDELQLVVDNGGQLTALELENLRSFLALAADVTEAGGTRLDKELELLGSLLGAARHARTTMAIVLEAIRRDRVRPTPHSEYLVTALEKLQPAIERGQVAAGGAR